MGLVARRTRGGGVPPVVVDTARTAMLAARRPLRPLGVLPDTLIIGAQRCGTTSLFRYLVEHPDVLGPPFAKGVHYYDVHAGEGLDWYRGQFPSRLAISWRTARRGGPPRVVEASPYYLFHPDVPSRVAGTLPDVRCIVVLRDPVLRAWSHHQHEVQRGFEELSFADALDAEDARLAGEVERMAADPTYVSHAHQHFAYASRGRYVDQLERWFDHVHRARVLVVSTDELTSSPGPTMTAVHRFLDLEPLPEGEHGVYNARSYPDLDPAIAARLRDEFAPYDERLWDLLGTEPWW